MFRTSYVEMDLSILVVFLTSFILILYALEFFIYRKIKLIYKTIHNQKLQKFSQFKFSELSRIKDPVSDVTEEVLEWAINQKDEIDQLKENESFLLSLNTSHNLLGAFFLRRNRNPQ